MALNRGALLSGRSMLAACLGARACAAGAMIPRAASPPQQRPPVLAKRATGVLNAHTIRTIRRYSSRVDLPKVSIELLGLRVVVSEEQSAPLANSSMDVSAPCRVCRNCCVHCFDFFLLPFHHFFSFPPPDPSRPAHHFECTSTRDRPAHAYSNDRVPWMPAGHDLHTRVLVTMGWSIRCFGISCNAETPLWCCPNQTTNMTQTQSRCTCAVRTLGTFPESFRVLSNLI